MTDTPTPAEDKLSRQDEEFLKFYYYSVTAFETAAARLGMNPLDLAERLQDGGIAEAEDALAGTVLMLNTELRQYNDEPWAKRVRAAWDRIKP